MIWLVIVLGLAVALLAVLVVGLLRSHAEILRALHDLGVSLDPGVDGADAGARTFDVRERAMPPGVVASPKPGGLGGAVDLMGVTPTGETAAIALVGAERPALLAFLSSGCSTCIDFWEGFRSDGAHPAGLDARLVVVTHGEGRESPAAVAGLAAPGMTVLMSSEAFDDYSVTVAPYFVLVDGAAGKVVGEGAARTYGQLRDLLGKAAADAGLASGGGGRRSRRQFLSAPARAARVDAELAAAGIGPGHPSLYPDAEQPAPAPTTPPSA